MHETEALLPGAASGARPLPAWGWVAVATAVLVLFLVTFENGQLVHSLLGKAGVAGNYLHELFHDGRHLLGGPCH